MIYKLHLTRWTPSNLTPTTQYTNRSLSLSLSSVGVGPPITDAFRISIKRLVDSRWCTQINYLALPVAPANDESATPNEPHFPKPGFTFIPPNSNEHQTERGVRLASRFAFNTGFSMVAAFI